MERSKRDEVFVGLSLLACSHLKWVAPRTKSLLRKSPTSSVVDGPPMFMKTMAVGPLEPAALWVTGGATDALPLLHCEAYGARTEVAEDEVTRWPARAKGVRSAIEGKREMNKLAQRIIDEVFEAWPDRPCE